MKSRKMSILEKIEKRGQVTPKQLKAMVKGISAQEIHDTLEQLAKEDRIENGNSMIRMIGRHTNKYIFQKETRTKSQTVYHVVSAYMNDHRPTLAELKEAFPDTIVSCYGVIAPIKEAIEKSISRRRYHLMEDMILTTKDKKKVVVTNQWDVSRFHKFIVASRGLGYKIKLA